MSPVISRVWRASELSNLQLTVPSTGSGKLYLVLVSSGVRENGIYAVGGSGLAVTREWLDAEGSPVSFASHELGDLVYTRIRVTNKTGGEVQNIALVDRIPAGWEIENPRLGHGSTVDWLDPEQAWAADHMNLRDDRLELFGSLEAGQTRDPLVVHHLRRVSVGLRIITI